MWALNPDGTKQKPQPAGYPYWVEVTTTPDGYNDLVWATTLCQCFLLNLGESPFYANYGLPAEQAIIQQIAPGSCLQRAAWTADVFRRGR